MRNFRGILAGGFPELGWFFAFLGQEPSSVGQERRSMPNRLGGSFDRS
jgi:hypothetical protein